jgi:hypothetical protein
MMKKFANKTSLVFFAGLTCGVLCCALPSYCVNQYAWDNLNRSKDLLLQQLDHISSTKRDLIEKQAQVNAEYQKRIDTLSEYEDHLNNSLREVEDAMK